LEKRQRKIHPGLGRAFMGLLGGVCVLAPAPLALAASADAAAAHADSPVSAAGYLLLLLAIIGLILWLGRLYSRHLQARKAREHLPEKETPSPFARFCKKNPDFTQEDLLGQTARIFELLAQAFGARDLTAIRPLVGDACYAQLERELYAYCAGPSVLPVTRITLLTCCVTGYSRQAGRDNFILHLSVAPTYAPAPEGMAYLEAQRVPRVNYQWTLGRPCRLQTIKGPQIQAQECPRCGAPLTPEQPGHCGYCGATLSPEIEWTVYKILRMP
jgi:hypothetical protein